MEDKNNRVREERAPESQPAPETTQLSLDEYCRSVAQSIPAETLSVFYTTEMAAGRGRATFDAFQARMQEFMNAPLG